MISNQIIQTSIDELKAITKVDLYVYDVTGSLIAGTTDRGTFSNDLVISFAQSPADSQVIGNDHLLKVLDEGEPAYILIARGQSEDVYMIARIAVSQIQALIVAYKERFDRNNFFQNLLLDNLLLVDIYNRAKKLHIDAPQLMNQGGIAAALRCLVHLHAVRQVCPARIDIDTGKEVLIHKIAVALVIFCVQPLVLVEIYRSHLGKIKVTLLVPLHQLVIGANRR